MTPTTTTQAQSFIEAQFPVSKVSKESYKERTAAQTQTLTGIGKWWGRKPLVLVRAALLGLILPPSDDPKKDQDIFLKLMTMDDDGLLRRRSSSIPYKELFELLTEEERDQYFSLSELEAGKPIHHTIKGHSREEKELRKEEMQALAFSRLSYDDKLTYCDRPEQIDGPSEEAWQAINAHLGTQAKSLDELVHALGERRFGHIPQVGDAFCGGGSIPFEAARLGFNTFGADINPVAALLTWAAIYIIGGDQDTIRVVRQAQKKIFSAVDDEITELGIEHNNKEHRADTYLYCSETICPECGVRVPLVSSWVIGQRTPAIAQLELLENENRFDIRIIQDASKRQIAAAKKSGTVRKNALHCPACEKSTPIAMIRGDRSGKQGRSYGLRMWEKEDIVPRPDDIFQERLYCIRWVYFEEDDEGKKRRVRYYAAPAEEDLSREQKVLEVVQDNLERWQESGYIPSRRIESGYNTDQPIREKGWTYWHHLFNPRQLLYLGLFNAYIAEVSSRKAAVGCLMGLAKAADYGSRLSRWNSSGDKIENVFYNQALNTLYDYGTKGLLSIRHLWFYAISESTSSGKAIILPAESREITQTCDIWVTDPPYADAVNYDELSEFFIPWYDNTFRHHFPTWYLDSKRALAVRGSDEAFRLNMVACYRNLAAHMPDDGVQIVMFTHQDAGVWADLALILWAAGLRVTAAWTIATETDSALKQGNYVQGTVLLILRKRTSDDTAYTDELVYEIEDEVKAQLDTMQALDEDERDPNFGDTDYQLAAYAAALRVLTQYRKIEDIDVERELARPRASGETSPIAEIIEQAVKIACDHLVPKGFDTFIWKTLTPEERLYLKGLELESHGEFRNGAYQELARGFGVREYTHLFASGNANETRFMNATEFGTKELGKTGFSGSLVRNALFAVREARKSEETSTGRNWLKNEVPVYWQQRKTLIEILNYLANMGLHSEHWRKDSEAARLVAGAVENDHA